MVGVRHANAVYGVIGTFTAIALMLAVEVGMAPVLNRFIQQDPLEDGRWMIFNNTISAVGEFFPLGSGIGTPTRCFLAFRTLALMAHLLIVLIMTIWNGLWKAALLPVSSF